MTTKLLSRAVLLATAASMAASTLVASGASAQDYEPPTADAPAPAGL